MQNDPTKNGNPPPRYQSADDDDYPRFGRLLFILLLVMLAVGVCTWAAMRYLG
ncbi:hypothetical protein [Chitinimonas naiadis]